MLEHLIKGIEIIDEYQDSKLYSHVKFDKNTDINSVTKMLRDSLEKDIEFDFMKNEPDAKKLFNMLGKC